MTTAKVTRKIQLGRGARGRRTLDEPTTRPVPPAGRLPRITKLMALAIRFDQLIWDGIVKDQAEIARLGFVTRARVTQIMNLLNLAPEIQVYLLELDSVSAGKDQITERQLRVVTEYDSWTKQMSLWLRVRTSS